MQEYLSVEDNKKPEAAMLRVQIKSICKGWISYNITDNEIRGRLGKKFLHHF